MIEHPEAVRELEGLLERLMGGTAPVITCLEINIVDDDDQLS
jgi:hypothetical protein